MYANSNLIITAWDDYKLVGISRSLTDFCYCCYLSDLAVRQQYKCSGIGKRLIELAKEKVGGGSMLLLYRPLQQWNIIRKLALKSRQRIYY
jgi:ribosomal protein S18 acetylase RimI-like enzyme